MISSEADPKQEEKNESTMKHIFLVNPFAGHSDGSENVKKILEKYDGKLDYEIFVTQSKEESAEKIRSWLIYHPEEVRFYGIGGDGTFFNLVNAGGLSERIQYAPVAAGSGNDFVKGFTNYGSFNELENLISGHVEKIDVLDINGYYTMNMGNFGFDGKVVYNMMKIKRWPLMSGKTAYLLATAWTILGKLNQKMRIVIDGKEVRNDLCLLTAVSNGTTCGGGFVAAPHAVMDDGKIDVCCVRKIKKTQLATLMKVYRAGKHLKNEKTKKILSYYQCTSMEIHSDKDIVTSLDGEIMLNKDYVIRLLPKALNIVVPEGSSIVQDGDLASLPDELSA